MNDLFAIVGISKQAHAQALQAKKKSNNKKETILAQIRAIRLDHPRMGLRKLYARIKPDGIGRDAFIALASDAGLAVRRVRNPMKTTRASRYQRFPNLIAGTTLNDLNQVWVSDITYYRLNQRHFYITLIMDLYSRRILGACVAPGLHADWLIALLQTTIESRLGKPHASAPSEQTTARQLIHHSDRGSQYRSDGYLRTLAEANIAVSSAMNVLDNAHNERLNGIIKQEYLDCWAITTQEELEQAVAKIVERYNTERPHFSLALRTPMDFEAYLQETPIDEHPRMTITPEYALRAGSMERLPHKT